MKKSSMPLFQILKGWLFIAVAAVALYLMATVMEKMHEQNGTFQSTPPMPQQNPTTSTQAPSETQTRTSPSENPLGDEAQDESSREMVSSQEQDMPPVLGSTEPESSPITPAEESTALPELSENEDQAPLETSTSTPSDVTEQALTPGPEATSFEPSPALNPEADMGEDQRPTINASDQPEIGSFPKFQTCSLFLESFEQPEFADRIDENMQMLLWENRSGQNLSALIDGQIVNIFQSPYTGRTAYLLSEDGRHCVIYGYLERMAPGLVKGSRLTCGDPIALANKRAIAPHVGIKVLAVAPGASWWQGQAMAPSDILPELCPPEPEEEAQAEDPAP